MPTFKITVAYDGTDLVGWQRQALGPSVQGLLEDALGGLEGAAAAVVGAGRTDAGVHALGQVASFTLARTQPGESVRRAMNARLPSAVRVLAAEQVAASFHARFAAKTKTYRYRMWNAPVMNPFERRYAWHLPGTLDVDAMAEAAGRIRGRHDFSAFRAAGSAPRTSERTILSSRVRRDAELVTYEISGDGFLRHMVRTIVGSLVEIGRRRRPGAWMDEALESRERACAGPTAPPQGLFLVEVGYDPALAAEP